MGNDQYHDPGSSRPTDAQLLAALLNYREDPGNAVLRISFALLLRAAVLFAVRGLCYRMPELRPQQDELAQAAMVRLLEQEEKHGMLLAGFDPAMKDPATGQGGKSVYSWVWQNCHFAALDWLKASHAGAAAGRQHIPLAEFEEDADDVHDTGPRETPAALQLSETPLRASMLRIRTLTPWLNQLADEMVGQPLVLPLADGRTRTIELDLNHRRAWLGWLALDNSRLVDVSEQVLADELGVAKTTIQRETDQAYAFMLAHPDFSHRLDLMVPNSVRGFGVSDADLRTALFKALNARKTPEAPGGKVVFRGLVHAWVNWYAEQQSPG